MGRSIYIPNSLTSAFNGYQCFIKGPWKGPYGSLSLKWFCLQEDIEGSIMRARSLHRSLFPLHSELEDFIWIMHCMLAYQKMMAAFAANYSELVKMVSTLADGEDLLTHLETG